MEETLSNKRQHSSDDKQTLANQRRRRSDSPAAAGPAACWLLVKSCCINGEGSDADAKTRAACLTSSGKPFSVSLGVAAPPAWCSLHLDWLGGAEPKYIRVIAGHDDALLIQIRVSDPSKLDEHFLYEAGGGRAPSLSLLPGCNIPRQFGYRNPYDPSPRFRDLSTENTGILRRRSDLVMVCQLEKTCDPPIYDTAELCMLRMDRRSSSSWINRRLPIVEHPCEGSRKVQPWRKRHYFIPQAAVPVGNRFLCWVDYNFAFMLCDMGGMPEETPKVLRYVPLPPVTPRRHDDGYYRRWPNGMMTLGAAGPDMVRFVSVSSPPSSSSFNDVVTTWTMTLSTEEATGWVKDDDLVLDCDDEISKCLPRDTHLEYPMVSSDDPDVIYFKVGAMAAAINTRTKKLLSLVPRGLHLPEDEDEAKSHPHHHLITAKLGW